MMSIDSPLRATAGAACRFSVDSWGLITETERTFDELNNAQVSDEAYVAAFAGVPPSRLSLALGYSEFKPEVKKEVIIPYITEEVSIELPYGVSRVAVMGGVRHVCITSCLSEPSVHLPDSVVSCHIDRGVALAQLSIAPRLARNWSYWSALWGKSYTVPQNFRRTPDGLVTVRLSNEQRLCLA
ncbi:hypothetical protein FACS1894208_00480 [Clostridia bacterium]|nr:hypothetical protein FACS1894208_00480 [Clostridia bacterium]